MSGDEVYFKNVCIVNFVEWRSAISEFHSFKRFNQTNKLKQMSVLLKILKNETLRTVFNFALIVQKKSWFYY